MLSYHELQFLTAEAYARLGENTSAEAALKAGINAAFEKVGLTADEAEEYYTQSVQARFSAHPLKEIMMQKYLSFYEDEAVEAYNDYRRLKAMGEDLIPWQTQNLSRYVLLM
ncbi:MAG: SusD/RagB family nutrient-binding outer membrane lipoprotein, partial [Barnesiella sp.]